MGNSFHWLKEQKGKPSDLLHEHLKNESPHKETFEATKIGLEILTLLDTGIGAASYFGKISKIKKLNAAEKVANSKKAEKILNESNKEILGVNKGISNAKNIDELFTTNEIKNLKSTVIEEGQMLKDMKWGKRKIYNDELGPAIAGVYNKRNGRIYTAINDMDGEIPAELSKTIGKRIENMPDDVLDLYIEHTKGAGSHA
ncbi:hypothetical protein DVW05_11945 [Clostridium botulinum]|uniref:YwqJ-related putative deaminase n=1 Tax=Clostridium sp. ZBS18 TaxID=2949967 RepID=UPI001DEAE690|nr:YwqJ-related putative deaminase [Clostridium sp. ZBS18]MBN1056054.1 hypothetical protein [Clostridium botulinum]